MGLPIVLHEDGGPWGVGKSANVVSFSSLLGRGSELECKFPIATCVAVTGEPGHDSVFWQTFFGDLDNLAKGLDQHGNPVAADGAIKWGAVNIFGKADMEVECLKWGLSSYNAAEEVCAWCLANRTTRPFTDLKPTAAWVPSADNMPNEFFVPGCSRMNMQSRMRSSSANTMSDWTRCM